MGEIIILRPLAEMQPVILTYTYQLSVGPAVSSSLFKIGRGPGFLPRKARKLNCSLSYQFRESGGIDVQAEQECCHHRSCHSIMQLPALGVWPTGVGTGSKFTPL